VTSQLPPEPVFLLSPARSCSSLVSTMLGGHPQVYGFPELRLFIGESIEVTARPHDLAPEPWTNFARSGLIRAVAELMFGSQSAPDIDAAFRWLDERSSWAPSAVFDVLRAAVAPRIALEKSPDTINTDRTLELCVQAYPDARFVHLVRHPISTITSMIQHWAIRMSRCTPRELALVAARSWFNGHRRSCTLRDTLPPGRVLRIRAEDILAHPLHECARFAAWLALDSSPQAIERMLHPELSPYARSGPERAPGGNDPKFLKDPRLRIGPPRPPGQFPAQWGLGTVEREALARLATYFGYDVSVDTRDTRQEAVG
jgi:hypothetical protein